MAWAMLDANMRAADAHYDTAAAYDHSFCEECLRPFAEDGEDGDDLVTQDSSRFHLCVGCADA